MSLTQVLWVAQLLLLGFLAIVLVAKKAWRSFPFFTVYSLFNLLSGVIEFFLYKSPRLYMYVYIVIEILSILLGLGVLYEVFIQLFSSQRALRKLATFFLCLAVVLLVALSVSVVYLHAPGFRDVFLHAPALKNLLSAIVISEEAARALEVGLLVFLFACSTAFGLQWRQPIFGIALGLGVFTTVQLIIMTVWTYIIGSPNYTIIGVVDLLAFNFSLILWIGYLAAPEQIAATEVPDKSQLEQWNRAVMELIHQ